MKLLSVREAAERLGVSAALIYELCAARRIRHERHGLRRGVIRIPPEALDEYRKRKTVEPEAENPRASVPLVVPEKVKLQHLA